MLVAAVALAIVAGLLLRRRAKGFRPVRGADGLEASAAVDPTSRLDPAELGVDALGERATFVHFSSAFCAPCRTTRQTLSQVSKVAEGVRHVEIDAESQLELVRRVGVRRTPTVLVLDADGRILTRASGALRKADVLAVLDAIAS